MEADIRILDDYNLVANDSLDPNFKQMKSYLFQVIMPMLGRAVRDKNFKYKNVQPLFLNKLIEISKANKM